MKLNWPLWAIVTAWLGLFMVGVLGIIFLWTAPIGLVGSIVVYILYGAFVQSVGYGVTVGKKTLEAWKRQAASQSGSREPDVDSDRQLAWGFIMWLLCISIIYIPFLIISFGER